MIVIPEIKDKKKIFKIDLEKINNGKYHQATLEIYERAENTKNISETDKLILRKGRFGCCEFLKNSYYSIFSIKQRKLHYFLYYVPLDNLINPFKEDENKDLKIDNLGYANFWLEFINEIGFKVELIDINENYKHYNCDNSELINKDVTKETKCLVYKIEFYHPNTNKFFINWQAIRYLNSNVSYLVVQNSYRLKKLFGDKLDNFTIFQLAHLYIDKLNLNNTWQIVPNILSSFYGNDMKLNILEKYMYLNDGCYSTNFMFPFFKTFDDFIDKISKSSSINESYYKINGKTKDINILNKLFNFSNGNNAAISCLIGDNILLTKGLENRLVIQSNLVNNIDEENEFDYISDIVVKLGCELKKVLKKREIYGLKLKAKNEII